MKYLLLFKCFGILLFSSTTILAQENKAVGYFYDYLGEPLDGYLGTDYTVNTDLTISEYISSYFVEGAYYDTEGKKIKGYIKFNPYNSYFLFTTTREDKHVKIAAEDCMALTIRQDSFHVINDFIIEGNYLSQTIKSSKFAHVIESFNNRTYYKYNTTFNNKTVTYFLFKDKEDPEIYCFPKNNKTFLKTAITAFDEFPSLIQSIKDEKYIEEDILQLIKLYKYRIAFINNDKIFLDSQLNEIDEAHKASYYALIEELNKSSYIISYYTSENVKIHSGQFKSIFPFKRAGKNIWYHSNGQVRKEIIYINDDIASISTFDIQGNKFSDYVFDYNGVPSFKKVYNEDGINILEANGNGEIWFHDHVRDIQVKNIYKDHVLFSSHYLSESNQKIYLRAEQNLKLKAVKTLAGRLRQDFEYPTASINKGNEGIIYLKLLVDESGLTKSIQILKGVDLEIDENVLSIINFIKTYKHWKPAKMGKEKVSAEIILPVQVILQSFNPFRYNNMYWMNNQMFMQQMFMQFTPPTSPPMPPKFN